MQLTILSEATHVMNSHRMARFLFIGAYNTLFGYLVFVGLYYGLGGRVHYNAVLAIAYVFSVTNSYVLQRRFVFRAQTLSFAEFLRFNVVTLGGMCINMGFLSLAVTYLTANVALAQAAAVTLTIAFTYVGHTYFSFIIPRDATGGRE